MANQPFYPNREGDQTFWFSNIQGKIAGYYTALDISPARQTKLTLTLNWLIWTWQVYSPTRRPEGPAALTPPSGTPYFGMLTWLFEEIARWKTAEGYTDTIGKDLGVIGAAATTHDAPPLLTQGDAE